jgi:hypothetical protein
MEGIANLSIARWRSSKQLRRWIRQKGKAAGWRRLKQGDAGIVLEVGAHTIVQVAVGRDQLFVEVSAKVAARRRPCASRTRPFRSSGRPLEPQ